jgi:hypothetical protein
MLQKIGVGYETLPQPRFDRAVCGDRSDDAGQVRCLGDVRRQIAHVPTHGFELPSEGFDTIGTGREQQQLVDQTGNDVRAQSKASGAVIGLLSLDPGTLEEGLVRENI